MQSILFSDQNLIQFDTIYQMCKLLIVTDRFKWTASRRSLAISIGAVAQVYILINSDWPSWIGSVQFISINSTNVCTVCSTFRMRKAIRSWWVSLVSFISVISWNVSSKNCGPSSQSRMSVMSIKYTQNIDHDGLGDSQGI